MLGISRETNVSVERDFVQVVKAARQQAAMIIRHISPERASLIMMETELGATANLVFRIEHERSTIPMTEMPPISSQRKASMDNSSEPRYECSEQMTAPSR